MKKAVATILSIMILITSCLSVRVWAEPFDQQYSYFNANGEEIFYYKDFNGETYIVENGEKVYIAVPVLTEKITDSDELSKLRKAATERNITTYSVASATLPYSKTMNFSSTIDTTDMFYITYESYLSLKCSELNPFGAKRGFSYYVRYSPDGSTWYRTLYVNQSLWAYTKHRVSDFGNGPYIQIQMWSYYGTVDSCLLSIK